MQQPDCVFCKILTGELPSTQVYADESAVAFLDIAPAAKGHVLVIPRGHYANMLDMPAGSVQPVFAAAQKVARALMAGLGAEGVNVMQNNFSAAGQMVFHVHWHIIPRFTGDGFKLWSQGAYDSVEEMRGLAERICAHI